MLLLLIENLRYRWREYLVRRREARMGFVDYPTEWWAGE